MTYLIVGEESLIKKTIDDIKEKEKIDVNSISNYDMETDNINDAIMDINTFNIFADKKIVVVNKVNILTDAVILEKYLDNQNNNILILTDTNIDERKKIIKKIKEKSKVILTKEIDLNDYIKNNFNAYKIDNNTINLLKQYCNNNYFRVKNEIDKLKSYKNSDKEITIEDIKKIVRPSIETSVFELTGAINKKNHKEIFDIYYKLLLNGEDEIKLTSILANNFRMLLKVKLLLLKKNDDEIIKILKLHPYRFKMLKKDAVMFNISDLLKYIKDLSDMDIKVKKGDIDKKDAMELFLARI